MSLRHRSAKSDKSALYAGNELFLESPRFPARARQKLEKAIAWTVEGLERRTLLTTLHGGDQLVFQNEDGNFQSVALFGNITAEIIGANVGAANQLELENLPGQVNGRDVNGGFNIVPGAVPVGQITVSSGMGGTLTGIQPRSIAVDPSGQMYGIVTQLVPDPANPGQNVVEVLLVHFNQTPGGAFNGSSTLVADITTQISAAAGGVGATFTSSPGAAFDPATGLLYFTVVTTPPMGQMNAKPMETLFTVDVNSLNVAGSVAAVGSFGTALNPITNVGGLAFLNGNLTGTQGNSILPIDPNTAVLGPATNEGGGPLTGLAQTPVSVTNPNGGLYFVSDQGAASDVLFLDTVTFAPRNVLENYERLDPPGNPNTPTGQNPGDLTFDALDGNLYSFDTATGQLFIVSQADRTRDLSIFQIYVSQSDPTGEIVTSQFDNPVNNNNPHTEPYGAGISGIRATNAQNGMPLMVAAPAGSGDALIGAREHAVGTITSFASVPTLTQTIAAIPTTTLSPFGSAPYTVGESITAGIVSAPGTQIGKILVSGPIMGEVHLGGSIDTMYAGWLLTGNAGGEESVDIVSDPGNFTVDGDIRYLYSQASIGTDSDTATTKPTYVTGFDMHVGGTIGMVRSFDSIVGNINDNQSPTAPNLTTAPSETEVLTPGNAHPWDTGILAGNAEFSDESFATPQMLGAIPTSVNGLPSAAIVTGVLQDDPPAMENDLVDYYGVALMGGQSVTVQLTEQLLTPLVGTLGLLDVGVFDPDGDLIASDYNKVNLAFTQGQPFRFTADRPGVYRFAIASEGNPTFTAAGQLNIPGDVPYTLTISGIGDLAVGAICATNNIFDNAGLGVDPTTQALITQPEAGFGTLVGDLGAISANFGAAVTATATAFGAFFSENLEDTVIVQTGNLRDIDAGSVGLNVSGMFDPEIQVPNGSVGLVESTVGILNLNSSLAVQNPTTLLFTSTLAPPIGGDYQIVSAAGDLNAELVADGSIGVIRAASIIPLSGAFREAPSFFTVNAAKSTVKIGHIDLIDSAGDVGSAADGGPHISTGPQGNVGYFHVSNTSNVFEDDTISGGGPNETLFQPGESATLTDDSGAQVVITPTGTPSVPGTVGVSNTTGVTVNPNLPQLSVLTYGIEGTGGVAIINVTSTGGVTITSSGDSPGQTVQIGEIDALGLGQNLVQPLAPATTVTTTLTGVSTTGGTTAGGTTTTNTTFTLAPTFFTAPDTAGPVGRTLPLNAAQELDPNSETPLNVIMQGTAETGVFQVYGGFISSIVNNTTGGEIVNTIVRNLGTLSSKGTIGLAQGHTGAAADGLEDPVSRAEFVKDLISPEIGLHAHSIIEEDGLRPYAFPQWGITGFSPALGTTVTTLTTFTTTMANGSVTTQTITPVAVGVTVDGIAVVQASQGIGNLDVLGSGLPPIPINQRGNIGSIVGSILGPCYATAQIHDVTLGSGGIAASGSGAIPLAGLFAVGTIGIISNSVPADIRGTVASQEGITGINLKNGSLIGAKILSATDFSMATDLPVPVAVPAFFSPLTNPVFDVGNLITDGNGGIIGTFITGDHIGHIDVRRGFGIFNSLFQTLGDGTLAGLLADGYGIRGTTYAGGASVGSIVATGKGQNLSTALYSADVRTSETNVVDPFSGLAPGPLDDIDTTLGATAAQPQVPASNTGGTDAGVIQDCTFTGQRDLGSLRAWRIRATDPLTAPTVIFFADAIGSITSFSTIDGLTLTTGRLKKFQQSGDVLDTTFQIAGPIKSLVINGNFMGTSTIAATGKNGNIGALKVLGNLQGSITANRRIQSVVIGGNLSGLVSAQQVNSLKVGSLTGGNLDIQGSVGVFQTTGDLGLPSETLTIHGSVKAIRIGGNLNANIVVQGNLGTLQVGQSVLGGTTTHIVNTLGLLSVDGDVQAGATITAALIKKQKIKGLVQGTIN